MLVVAGACAALNAQADEGLQAIRRHWIDAGINVLTLHNIDQVFATRRVENSDAHWELPRAAAPLDFSYEFGGSSHPADDIMQRTFTNALVIIRHGKIVHESYRNQTSENSHFVSFSMAKSVTSLLIGIAIERGQIHGVDDPITTYVPELRNSAYDGVTLRQALDMRSGADYVERYDNDRPNLLATAFEEAFVSNRANFADFARTMKRAYPPGEHYSYSTFETGVLGWVLERATGQSISAFMSEQLWKPAGMESYGYWMIDGPGDSGREFSGGGFNAIARDYARLGLLMLREGKAAQRQVVPRSWVSEIAGPAAHAPAFAVDPAFGYHYQWWPLRDSSAYMASGLLGHCIYVDPASDTVVVKLSSFPPGNADAGEETTAFLRAVSKWQPGKGKAK